MLRVWKDGVSRVGTLEGRWNGILVGELLACFRRLGKFRNQWENMMWAGPGLSWWTVQGIMGCKKKKKKSKCEKNGYFQSIKLPAVSWPSQGWPLSPDSPKPWHYPVTWLCLPLILKSALWIYDYICSLINALNNNLSSAYYAPDNLLGTRNERMSKLGMIPDLMGLSL